METANPATDVATEQAPFTFTRWLRWAGTGILLLGLFDFLVKGLVNLLPAYRYVAADALALLLGACGLISGYRWRDTVGARWFFVLAVVCVPVQYTQISALLIDHVGPAVAVLPYWLQNDSLPLRSVLLDFAVSTVLLVPIAVIAFRTLARSQAQSLAMLLLCGCALLLVPLRTTPWVQVLLAALYLTVSRHDRKCLTEDPSLRTVEGTMARLLVWTPVFILFARSLFYSLNCCTGNWWGMAALAGLSSLFFLRDAPGLFRHAAWQTVSRAFGLSAAVIGWLCFINGIISRVVLPADLVLYLQTLPIAIVMLACAEKFPGHAQSLRSVASWLIAATMLAEFFASYAYLQAACTLLAGVGLISIGIRHQSRTPLSLGVLCAVSGLLRYLSALTHLYALSPWLVLALSGVAILLLASYLDTHGRGALSRSRNAWQTVKHWY